MMKFTENPGPLIKITIVGDSGVGKSSFVANLMQQKFRHDREPTIALDISVITMKLDGRPVRFKIFDTAGLETHHSMGKLSYQGATACLFLYDTTRRESFDRVIHWVEVVREVCDPIGALIGTKRDLAKKREVLVAEARGLAVRLGFDFGECSSRKGSNVRPLFERLAKRATARFFSEDDIAGPDPDQVEIDALSSPDPSSASPSPRAPTPPRPPTPPPALRIVAPAPVHEPLPPSVQSSPGLWDCCRTQ